MENLRKYGEYGWRGNFWQIGKLGQVWGKYEKNGEVCWDVGVKGCVGEVRRSAFGVWEVCWGRGGGVGRVGKYWKVWKMCGSEFGVWGGVGKCVWVWGEV